MCMYLIKYLKCTDHGSLRSSFFMKSLASSLVPEKYSSSKLKWNTTWVWNKNTFGRRPTAHNPNIYTLILQWPWDDLDFDHHTGPFTLSNCVCVSDDCFDVCRHFHRYVWIVQLKAMEVKWHRKRKSVLVMTKECGVLQTENPILPMWPWPNDLDTQTWLSYC